MPTELELCAVSAVVGALLGGALAYTVTHKIDGAALAHEKQLHADDIARINATAAKQLADAIDKKQVAEGRVATIQQQYEQEIANHAKDSLDYRAQLLNGTQRVRVRVSGCGDTGTGSKGAAATGRNDDAPAVATLDAATAASAVAVTDSGDAEIIKLRKLQDYVKELQADGYISK